MGVPLFNLSQISSNDVKMLIFLTFLGGVIGFIYTEFVYFTNPDNTEGSVWLGFAIGASIMFVSGALELWLVSHPYSPFKRIPFLLSLFVRITMHIAVVLAVSVVCHLIYGYIYDIVPFFMRPEAGEDIKTDTFFSIIMISVIVFFLQIRMLIGGGQLRNIFIGKYHQPRKENRIFMFVDVANSTAIASEIGDILFHKYLNDLFVLIERPIRSSGGNIHSYVGDAVIAVWPFGNNRQKNGRVLETALIIEGAVQARTPWFEKKYGVVPAIRVALHAGEVVIGETGNSKRQITYLGNTVNLTARIEQKTKELGRNIVASKYLVSNCEFPQKVNADDLGNHTLKGIEGKINLYELTTPQQPAE